MARKFNSDTRTITKIGNDKPKIVKKPTDKTKSSTSSTTAPANSKKKKKNSGKKVKPPKVIKTLEGEISVMPYVKNLKIREGKTVKLAGVGKYLSVAYFVDVVNRTIDDSNNYTQSLELMRTGWSSSLKKKAPKKVKVTRKTKVSKKSKKKSTNVAKKVESGKLFLPVNKPKYISSPFGPRKAPTAGASTNHGGVDLRAAHGTNIYAADSGTVVFCGWQSGYGNTVEISHSGGRRTLYGHCSAFNTSKGKKVKRGAIVAKIGSTGVSTGPHLHFEVKINGERKDPAKYL